ncbi:MAG: hypothetical protein PHH54_05000 [Candidatus Nanoarchaeia archaeon]|nr:hypothetical protein [Candidatus Nanoarchaeia archaeon]MDD5741316.1 hypothetical protein [Candidatus Nanoarchaeia archaeon]
MKREIKLILSLLIFVASIIPIIHAQPYSINVEFNGNFINGTTLYSDVYIIDGYLYGKDVYPIRDSSQNQRQKICEIYYKNKTKAECTWLPGPKRICTKIPYVKEYQKCKWIIINPVKIACNNTIKGYKNQLKLENFKYSLDNSTWQEIPYHEISINSTSVYFKLDIPQLCSPEYYMNKAIFIR